MGIAVEFFKNKEIKDSLELIRIKKMIQSGCGINSAWSKSEWNFIKAHNLL